MNWIRRKVRTDAMSEAEEVDCKKYSPDEDKTPTRDTCAGVCESTHDCIFTFSFTFGMQETVSSSTSVVSPLWPGGRPLFSPP